MNTADIHYVLKGKVGNKILFRGVLAADQVRSLQIPNDRERDIAFVANILRLGDKRMGHWVVFLILKSPMKKIYFFDSYGMQPTFYSSDFDDFLKRNREYQLYILDRKLQSDESLVCGLYASWFIYHCSRYTLSKVIQILKKSFAVGKEEENDEAKFNFYLRKLNKKIVHIGAILMYP